MGIIEKKRLFAIVFFARKETNVTIDRLKLMKLLWLSDRIHLNRYGRMILNDTYNALPHGPVPSATMDYSKASHDDYFTVDGMFITATSEPDLRYFSQSDIKVMHEVWEKYGKMKSIELRNFTHKFPEWIRYRSQLKDKDLPNSYQMVPTDFFSPPVEKVDYEFDEELTNLAMNEYYIQQAFQTFLDK